MRVCSLAEISGAAWRMKVLLLLLRRVGQVLSWSEAFEKACVFAR